ncbi:myosin heavy chain, clone 203-like isoform X2 [Ruditapes philippinarum]|nr:myosin heavy chain, clone 203-like isoform X2 [Ruditapes philippinarum]
MSVEELGNILQSVMPQRDQDMRNLTDNLISMKDQEISRLEQNKREQAATISRLNDEIERLKGQLGDELPTLTERSTHLQNKVDTLTEQNRQFQDKIRTLEASLSSLKAGSLQAQQHRKNLEEQLKEKTKEMVTVKAQFDGVNKENLHLKLQLQSTKDDLKSQKEQLEKSESTTTQLKELLDQMFQQKQLSDAELDASRQSCLLLTEQVQQLHMYEVMYSEASQQLDYLNNTVVPQKDSAIDQLQQKITDLIDEVAVLQRNNIPQAEHFEILQTRLVETRQELKQYYEDEYGTKMASLERRNEAMKKHVTEMETELKNREDVGDELKAATRTYKGLIKENCDLKDKVKTLEKQNKHVAHYKERANNLERQISVLRNRIEE